MNGRNRYGWLLRLACQLLKFFGLVAFALAIACLITSILNIQDVFIVLVNILRHWCVQVGAIVGCFMVTAIVAESIRY